jgi:hypothetical protein
VTVAVPAGSPPTTTPEVGEGKLSVLVEQDHIPPGRVLDKVAVEPTHTFIVPVIAGGVGLT